MFPSIGVRVFVPWCGFLKIGTPIEGNAPRGGPEPPESAPKNDLEKRISFDRGRSNWPSGNGQNCLWNYGNEHLASTKPPFLDF